MAAVVVSLAWERVRRNCRRLLEVNKQTLDRIDELHAVHRSLTASLSTARDSLQAFSDSLDTSLSRLRESSRRQRRIMDMIERIQAGSDAFS